MGNIYGPKGRKDKLKVRYGLTAVRRLDAKGSGFVHSVKSGNKIYQPSKQDRKGGLRVQIPVGGKSDFVRAVLSKSYIRRIDNY